MSSGFKEMVINTQERALSVDINRLQKFKSRDLAEALRYLFNVQAGDDDLSPGVTVEYASLDAPLRAEILNGLLVRPQVGSFNLLIDPGMLCAVAPDAFPDESNYKVAKSNGVPVLGTLAMTGNVTASIRIDVIECQLTSNAVETDNRDIFNPTTGLFTAQSVTKAIEGGLTFRVRQGVAGSGFPASVTGWLPLCVASVPPGATSCDQITFWDVRPLLSDRPSLANIDQTVPHWGETRLHCLNDGGTSASNITGFVEVFYRGRKLGGRLRRGTPGTDGDLTDVKLLANQDIALTFPNQSLVAIYLAVPFGLPRWARYTDFGSGSRIPRAPRGILIASATQCDAISKPSSPLALPASTGLGGTTTDAVCISTGVAYNGGGTNKGLGSFATRDRQTLNINTISKVISGGLPMLARAQAKAGVHFPHNATQVFAKFRAAIQNANGGGARKNFNGITFQGFFADRVAASPWTGVTYAYNDNVGGPSVRVFADNVYYDSLGINFDAWLPVPNIWPAQTLHGGDAIGGLGYDIGWDSTPRDAESGYTLIVWNQFGGGAIYIQGWSF